MIRSSCISPIPWVLDDHCSWRWSTIQEMSESSENCSYCYNLNRSECVDCELHTLYPWKNRLMRSHRILKHRIAIAFSTLLNMSLLFSAQAGGIFDTSFPYTDNNYTSNPTTNVGGVLKQTNQGWSIIENMLDLFGINYAGNGKAISYVQIIINYVLALVAFIALLLIIYSFYMIFFGKSDDWIAKARKTIIWSSIAILVIGLSAYIVNFLFYLYARGVL